jgi:hypothetical protein
VPARACFYTRSAMGVSMSNTAHRLGIHGSARSPHEPQSESHTWLHVAWVLEVVFLIAAVVVALLKVYIAGAVLLFLAVLAMFLGFILAPSGD